MGFNIYFLNSAISGNIKVINMTFSVWFHNVRLEGSVSQISDLGLSFNFMLKKRFAII